MYAGRSWEPRKSSCARCACGPCRSHRTSRTSGSRRARCSSWSHGANCACRTRFTRGPCWSNWSDRTRCSGRSGWPLRARCASRPCWARSAHGSNRSLWPGGAYGSCRSLRSSWSLRAHRPHRSLRPCRPGSATARRVWLQSHTKIIVAPHDIYASRVRSPIRIWHEDCDCVHSQAHAVDSHGREPSHIHPIQRNVGARRIRRHIQMAFLRAQISPPSCQNRKTCDSYHSGK